MSSLPILIYEYFSGGGFPPGDLPTGLATEALGMLLTLLTDFHACGIARVATILDPRFEERVPGLNRACLPADEVVIASNGEHEQAFCSLLNDCAAALIIAPETDGILARFTAHVEEANIKVLGSNSSAIGIAGDKAACDRLFRSAGLPTPDTRVCAFEEASHCAEAMKFPLVIKPVDGIGSEGVCLARDLFEMGAALDLVRQTTNHAEIILQQFIQGMRASVSLLASDKKIMPMSLNLQIIEPGMPFHYSGIQAPCDHPMASKAFDAACAAASLIPGLKGYIGVDLVLSEDQVHLIEINPRMTTAYVALRQISKVNLAQLIWDACRNDLLPDQISFEGHVSILKDDDKTWGLNDRSMEAP
jgi:predicted ATP-grasp superfamily ATP-dependent carboligase